MDFYYLKQKRILLVDDEQDLLDMVVSILNEDGFQNIKTSKTVNEAVTISETYQPEFAILDVILRCSGSHRGAPFALPEKEWERRLLGSGF